MLVVRSGFDLMVPRGQVYLQKVACCKQTIKQANTHMIIGSFKQFAFISDFLKHPGCLQGVLQRAAAWDDKLNL